MKIMLAITEDNFLCCGRCGSRSNLTRDHYVPKCFGRDIKYNYRYVPLCEDCNRSKGNSIVNPDWYKYLARKQHKYLYDYLGQLYSSCKNDYLRNKIGILLGGLDVNSEK